MYKRLIFLSFFLFLFSGCISTSPEPSNAASKKNKKVFEEEDALIMFALRAEQLRDYESASKIFDKLYDKSNKKEYLYRSLQNTLVLKDAQKVINRIDEITDNTLDDYDLIRLKIIALIQQGRLSEAQHLAISLVERSEAVDDYILVSDIYVRNQEFDIAVKYLESAYFKDYNEKICNNNNIINYME